MLDLQLYIILVILFTLIIGTYIITNTTIENSVNEKIKQLTAVDLAQISNLTSISNRLANLTTITNSLPTNYATKSSLVEYAKITDLNNKADTVQMDLKFSSFIGTIMMWSGKIGTTLPDGWRFCDGTFYYGKGYRDNNNLLIEYNIVNNDIDKQKENIIKTPDLRSKFIVGASKDEGGSPISDNNKPKINNTVLKNIYDTFATGGLEEVTLNKTNIPPHSHNLFSARTGTTGNTGSELVTMYNETETTQKDSYVVARGYTGGNSDYTLLSTYNFPSRWFAKTALSGGKNDTFDAGNTPIQTLPPYYALAFIMRIY